MADSLLTEACKHLRLFGNHHLMSWTCLHLATLGRFHPIHRSASNNICLYFTSSGKSRPLWLCSLWPTLAVSSLWIENNLSIMLDSITLNLCSLEFLTCSSHKAHWLRSSSRCYWLRHSAFLFLALRSLLSHLHLLKLLLLIKDLLHLLLLRHLWVLNIDVLNHHFIFILLFFALVLHLVLRIKDLRILVILFLFSVVKLLLLIYFLFLSVLLLLLIVYILLSTFNIHFLAVDILILNVVFSLNDHSSFIFNNNFRWIDALLVSHSFKQILVIS